MPINYSERIPNNVNLADDRRLAAGARSVAAGLPAVVERDGPGKFSGLRCVSADCDFD